MARHKPGGRTTSPTEATYIDNEIPPLRRRRPGVFWFVMLATFAMVVTTFASFFIALQ